MHKSIRISPAMMVALLALVVALGGTAVAASRYIITSTTQIKPSVLQSIARLALAHSFEVKGETETVRPGQLRVASARCPHGDTLLNGGYDLLPSLPSPEEAAAHINVMYQGPAAFGSAWWVGVIDTSSTTPIEIRARVVCVKP